VVGDVSDRLHASHLVDSAVGLGEFKLLVNNASILGPSPQPRLGEYSIDALEEVFRVNVLAPVSLTQLALPYLRSTGGTVVNITSDAAVEPYEGWGGYGSSKAALEQVSSILAAEEPDLAVYWFDPGDMRTRMHQEAFPGEDISDRPLPGTRVPALIDLLDRELPSGRYTAESLLSETVST
jgi:NAD(P)-dependent dehydrogenase (short-subunit alcohol dehydrogenase family)